MKDVGLLNWDVMAVELNAPTKPADFVLAIVYDVHLLRTLRFDRETRYYLEPVNPAFENIHPEGRLDIVGVVTILVRHFDR